MQLTNQHLHDFIEGLPGGNVPQYAKLLNVSANRLNKFLYTTNLGKKLIKAGSVCAPIRGMLPFWATSKTKRGVLTAENVSMNYGGLRTIVNRLPPRYRSDAEHMFRMLIQMSAGNINFNDGMSEIVSPYSNLAIDHQQLVEQTMVLQNLNAVLTENVRLMNEQKDLLMITGQLREPTLIAAE